MKIQSRLLLAILPLSLAALLLIGTLAFLATRHSLTGEVLQHLESVASLQSHRLAAIVDRNLERLQLVASRTQLRLNLSEYNRTPEPSARLPISERMTRIIADAQASIPEFRSITVYALDGHVAASTDPQQGDPVPPPGGQPLSMSGDELFLDPRGELAVRLTGPLTLADQVIGHIVIETTAATLTRALADYSGLGQSGEGMLLKGVEGEGARYLAPLRFDPAAALRLRATKEDAISTATLAGRPVVLLDTPDYRGRPALAVARPITGTDWVLVVKMDRDEAFASVHRLAAWLGGTIAVALLLVAGVSLHFARRLTRPLAELTATTRRLRDGDLSPRLPHLGDDEIGLLARHFNDMAQRLAEADQARRQTIDILTQEVEERTRAEERLREVNAELQDANLAKSEFLATMSHEIRTPMNAIIGMADLLQESPLDPEQQRYVEVFQRAGNTLLGIINDILDLSKVESRQFKLTRAPIDIGELVATTTDILAPNADAKGIEMGVALPQDLPPRLYGDPHRLRQILVNLIGNAIKFTDRGAIGIEVALGHDTAESVELHVAVRDTGHGIPADRQTTIFEPFTQADSTITRRYGGTGLGLAISRRLVEHMGGRLWVESEIGRGSTFHFTARLARTTPEGGEVSGTGGESDAAPPSPPQRPLRILLAEDSPDNALLIRAYLAHDAHQVAVAEDGAAAVAQFAKGRFDLVLMDMQMPVVDGYTATRGIRAYEAKHGLARCPILALTAYALNGDARRSLDAGCDEHLTKPIKKAALLAAIARHTAPTPPTPPRMEAALAPLELSGEG